MTEAVVQRLAAMPEAAFLTACPASTAQLAPPILPAAVQLQACRRTLHIGGRYLKLRRGIPQSPWHIDGERKGEGSVQEAIEAAVLPALQADTYTFIAAGRSGGTRPCCHHLLRFFAWQSALSHVVQATCLLCAMLLVAVPRDLHGRADCAVHAVPCCAVPQGVKT